MLASDQPFVRDWSVTRTDDLPRERQWGRAEGRGRGDLARAAEAQCPPPWLRAGPAGLKMGKEAV